jgi:hypothetical protein
MACLVDSGWRTKGESGVYNFCLRSGGRFVPLKGAHASQLTKTVEESIQDWNGRTFKLVRFDDSLLKDELYFKRIKNRGSNWWLPRNISQDYELQLTDEYRKLEKGKTKWDTRTGNNHLGDAEKYQLLLPWWIENAFGKDALKKGADRLAPRIKGTAALALAS